MLSEMQRKYPKLFISGSPEEFGCEEGWHNLIDQLCNEINSLLSDDDAAMFSLHQVKQKFGELRFYAHVRAEVVNGPRILALVAEAKVNSQNICELCGAHGRLEQWRPGSGYWQTLCDAHGAEAHSNSVSHRS